MSTALSETTAVIAGICARDVVRCLRCRLNQFRTLSNLCRRCDYPLPPAPPLVLQITGPSIEIDEAASGPFDSSVECDDEHDHLYSRRRTVRDFPIGRRIRELRKGRKLTQHQMASKAHVPRTYISRIENARLLPGPLMLQRIAGALDVAILDLLPRRRNGNGHFSPEGDPFWTSLSGYFSQLRQREMLQVLDRVRDMVAERPIHSFTPAMIAR